MRITRYKRPIVGLMKIYVVRIKHTRYNISNTQVYTRIIKKNAFRIATGSQTSCPQYFADQNILSVMS